MSFLKKANKVIFLSIFLFIGLAGAASNSHAENVGHILISEIQISGESANDEFIELYNPTSLEIDLKEWDIKKAAKTGNIENIVTNIDGVIPASGYFLIVPRAKCGKTGNETCYKGIVEKDKEYTTSNYLATDNAIFLYDQNENLIDKVGWGSSMDFEGEVFQNNPQNNQSLERKTENNIMLDTDNNKNDFILQTKPSPQNVNSALQNNDKQGNGDQQEEGQDQGDSNQNSETQNSQQEETIPSGPYSEIYTSKIIITEFLPNPEDSDADNEFIEIYNAGIREENLGNWTLEDKIGNTKFYAIPLNTVLAPGEYKAFMSSETRIVLNNSGDGVILKNTKGETQDETPVCDPADEDISYALKDDGLWTWTKKPTPEATNIIETKDGIKTEDISINTNKSEAEDVQSGEIDYDFSDGIIVTEILPNPEGLDNKLNYEWIEIYNDSDKEVNLNGWKIDDIQDKGSKPYVVKEGRTIKPKEYLVFSNEETKIILNNTEDEVNVLWPDGTLVDNVSYKNPKEGFSFALFGNGKWDWTSEPSPGKENLIIKEPEAMEKQNGAFLGEDSGIGSEVDAISSENENAYEPEKENIGFIETDVDSAKKLPRFTNVKVSGIVSVSPGIFRENMFYISGSGLQIFSYSKIFGGIALGDKVELFGKMSEIGGEKRLLVESPDYIKIISHDNLLEPKLISTGEVGEIYEGYLVLIEGNVIGENGEIFYVDDGSGRAKIYIKPETRIKRPEMKNGDTVNITGIVSRTSLGYRILPRFQNDMRIGKISGVLLSEGVNRDASAVQDGGKKDDKIPFYYYGFLLAALVVLIDWGRMKVKK